MWSFKDVRVHADNQIAATLHKLNLYPTPGAPAHLPCENAPFALAPGVVDHMQLALVFPQTLTLPDSQKSCGVTRIVDTIVCIGCGLRTSMTSGLASVIGTQGSVPRFPSTPVTIVPLQHQNDLRSDSALLPALAKILRNILSRRFLVDR